MTQRTSDGTTPVRLKINSEHYDTTYSITINGLTKSYITFPSDGKEFEGTYSQASGSSTVFVNKNNHGLISGDKFTISFDIDSDNSSSTSSSSSSSSSGWVTTLTGTPETSTSTSLSSPVAGEYTVGSSDSWNFTYSANSINLSGESFSGDCTFTYKRAISTTIIADGLADQYHTYNLGDFTVQNADNIISIKNNNNESFTYSFSDSVATEAISIADDLTTNTEGSYFTYNNTTYDAWNDPSLFFSTYNKELIHKFSDYKFYNRGKGIYEIGIDDGFDVITGITNLKFAENKTVDVLKDIKGTFDQVTGLHTDSGEMFRLYNAAFARFPDADGLKYWIDQFSSGRNTRRVVAQSFLGSAEFTEKYGSNVSDETYVNNLYKNVLGRDADAEGLNYWVGNLSSGTETRYEALLGFSESAENKTLFADMTGFG